jgi:hypothetical protein
MSCGGSFKLALFQKEVFSKLFNILVNNNTLIHDNFDLSMLTALNHIFKEIIFNAPLAPRENLTKSH